MSGVIYMAVSKEGSEVFTGVLIEEDTDHAADDLWSLPANSRTPKTLLSSNPK